MNKANGENLSDGEALPGRGVASAGIWSLSGSVVMLLATVIATPFTIRLLGPANYGLWSLLQSTLIWTTLADLGMATASTKIAAEHLAKNDHRGEATVVYTSLLITVSITLVLVTILGLEAASLLGLFHIKAHQRAEGIFAVRIICVISLFNAMTGVFNTPQTIRLHWRGYTVITAGAALLSTVGAPITLKIFGGGIKTVAVVALVASFVAVIGNFIFAVRLQSSLIRIRINRRIMRRLLNFGVGLTVSGVAAIPLFTAERFFLAHDRSITTVAYYAVAASLGSTLMVLPQALTQPLMPALVRLRSQSRYDEYRQLCSRGLRVLLLGMIPAAIIGGFLAHPFLSLWAGSAYGVHSTGPFLILLSGVVCNGLAYVPYCPYPSARTALRLGPRRNFDLQIWLHRCRSILDHASDCRRCDLLWRSTPLERIRRRIAALVAGEIIGAAGGARSRNVCEQHLRSGPWSSTSLGGWRWKRVCRGRLGSHFGR